MYDLQTGKTETGEVVRNEEVLELKIVPDISGGNAKASLAQMRLRNYLTNFGH